MNDNLLNVQNLSVEFSSKGDSFLAVHDLFRKYVKVHLLLRYQ